MNPVSQADGSPQLGLFARQVPLVQVVPSRWQPRAGFDAGSLLELAESIRDHGLWNPILVFYNEDGEPELVAGERRVRASVAIALATGSPRWIAEHGDRLDAAVSHVAEHGWKQLAADLQQDIAPVEIPVHDVSDLSVKKLHQIAVAENIQRESLSLIEEARALQDLQTEHGYSQRDLARLVNKSQGWVQQRLAIGSASPRVQELVNTRVFTIAHVRALGGLPGPIQDAVAGAAQRTLESEGDNPATTRKIEKLARDVKAFLQAEAWEPEPGAALAPKTHNGRILVAHLLRSATMETLGEVVGKLGEWGALATRAKDAQEQELATVLAAWSREHGRLSALAHLWAELAPGAGLGCTACLWQQVRIEDLPGREAPRHYGCPRLAGEDVPSCLSYVGRDDPRWPQLVEVPWTVTRYLPGREHPELQKVDSYYLATPAGFAAICQAAAEEQAQQASRSTPSHEGGPHAEPRAPVAPAPAAAGRDGQPASKPSTAASNATPGKPQAGASVPKPAEPPAPPATVLVVRIVGTDPELGQRPVLVSVGGNNGTPSLVSGTYADLQRIIQAALDRCLTAVEPEPEATEELILAEV